MIYLSENLFYNTTAPGIILVLDNANDDAIMRIADTFSTWKEVEKYSRIVIHEKIARNDFNISPSRYVHTGEGEEYRPIAEGVAELQALEQEAVETTKKVSSIMHRLLTT